MFPPSPGDTRGACEIGGTIQIGETKTGKQWVVPLTNELCHLLEVVLSDRKGSPEQLLFPSENGTPLRLSNWRRRILVPAVQEANLEPLTPHDLRHTFAALAVKAGANVKVLQTVMGHTDIRLTLDTYGGLYEDDLNSLADQMQALSLAQ